MPKRILLLCSWLILSRLESLYAQDPVLPAIIPSSPQAFDFSNAGLLSNNLYTGTASLSIPLYNISLKNISHNVSLQYASNGIKMSDISSNVGIGFQLLAGGCITRIIRDESDGVPENEPWNSFPATSPLSSSLLSYLNYAHDYYWDTEPDEYIYNFNGMSGRFFVDSNGTGRCIPANNLKIQVGDNYGAKTITITTVDGTKYLFGEAETTNSFAVMGAHPYSGSFNNETAWFLTEITSQTGEWIRFNYGSLDITVDGGPYNVTVTPAAPNYCGGNQCLNVNQPGNNTINHDTRYLTGITSSSGVQVELTHEPRPDVTSNDLRVKSITVKENLSGTANNIKKYNFKYALALRTGDVVELAPYRYYLDTLISESIDGSGVNEKYVFEYYKRGNVSNRNFFDDWDIFGYQKDPAWWYYPGWEKYPVDSTHIDTAATRAYYKRNGFHDDDEYPNPSVAPVGMLTKVTFPTGGYQTFNYEPNVIFDGYAHGVVAGGMRVKSIENFDPLSGTSTKKFYKYTVLSDTTKSSGRSSFRPFYSYGDYNSGFVCGTTIQSCPSTIASANTLTPYATSGGGTMITYNSVIESDDPNFVNGGVEHTFRDVYVSSPVNIYFGTLFTPVPQNTESTYNGAETKTVVFAKKNNSFITLRTSENSFTADSRNSKIIYGHITRRRYTWPYGYNPPQAFEFEGFDLIRYRYNSFKYNLTKTVNTVYDEKGNNPVKDSVMYEYADSVHWMATKITNKASDTSTVITYNSYPAQFVSGTNVYYQMNNNRDMKGVLVESKTYRQGNLTAAQKTIFNNNFAGSIIVPEQIQTKMIPDTTNYRTRSRFYAYSAGGAIKEVSKENDVRQSYIYGYTSDANVPDNLPIAEITNASTAQVAYTSFEVGSKGGWTYSGTPQLNPASITGTKCYGLSSGNITRAVNSPTTYVITYWLKNNTGTATVNGSSSTLVINKNGWSLYTKTITGVTTVTISGTGKIDELRLYPQGSFMRTMTYRPFFGISSECDINNRRMYYDYDGFGRLILVRDENGNILKKNCYTYNGQAENCNLYGNVVKSVSLRRNNCGAGNITSAVTYTVAANTYFSTTQAGADALAQDDINANGQDYANANGVCTVGWYNVVKSGNYTRNNCGSGYVGSTVTYTVPAATYGSTTSQAAADALAQNDVTANGQNYANANGTCAQLVYVGYQNYSSGTSNVITFVFINQATGVQYTRTSTPNTTSGQFNGGQIPAGMYNVQISNANSGSYNYKVGCNLVPVSGTTPLTAYNVIVEVGCPSQIY